MSLPATDNELLLRFVNDHDDDAFRELVNRHIAIVMNVCRQVSPNLQDAEDACQATLMILSQQASNLITIRTLAGWLHRVAYRASIDVVRKHRRRKQDALPQELPCSDNSAFEAILRREQLISLHEELDRLPVRYRDAIVLCDLEGQAIAAAASMMDLTDASVKASLARGRRMLRVRLIRRGFALSAAIALMLDGQMSPALENTAAPLTAALQARRLTIQRHSQVNRPLRYGGRIRCLTRSSRQGTVVALSIIAISGILLMFGLNKFDSPASESPQVVDNFVTVPPSDERPPSVASVTLPITTSTRYANESGTSPDTGLVTSETALAAQQESAKAMGRTSDDAGESRTDAVQSQPVLNSGHKAAAVSLSDYRLKPGDTLGIAVRRLIGFNDNTPLMIRSPRKSALPPALGIPVTVDASGAVSIPLPLPAVNVSNLTLADAQLAIEQAMNRSKLFKPDQAVVLTTLLEVASDETSELLSSYRAQPGDVLGIYVEAVFGDRNNMEVHFPRDERLPASFGFPIPVRSDGTISLPLIRQVDVSNLSLSEIRQRIVDAYSEGPSPYLRRSDACVHVSLDHVESR
ncbi:MAG: sigma-70 family RNA polymerase sigma factor [Planctomycetales bacterium]|nr:sigma-70 family RNA polymerase sigma factor [Planctomycetales bacterium]